MSGKGPPGSEHEVDIPPVHALEAAQSQERKETEELLAKFNRRSSCAEQAPAEQDFVAYYAKTKSQRAQERDARPEPREVSAPHKRRVDLATLVTPRSSRTAPALRLVAVAMLMVVLVGGVAYIATMDGQEPRAPNVGTPPQVETAPEVPSARDDVPPPTPLVAAEPTASVEPPSVGSVPSPAASLAPNRATTPRGSSGAGRKPPRRDDLFRNP